MLSGPTAFPQIGGRLLQVVNARLAFTTGGTPDLAAMVPAPIVWDNCQCGLLAVAVARIYGTTAFPTDDAAGIVAGAPREAIEWPPFLVGQFQVAVVRCATTEPEPSAEALTKESDVGHEDAYEVLVGVACTLRDMLRAQEIVDYLLQDQPFLPAQGGCQGASLNALVCVPFSCPC